MNKALVTLRCEYCGQEKIIWEGGDIGRCDSCASSAWSESKDKRIESSEQYYIERCASFFNVDTTGCRAPYIQYGNR